jgi:hypothetical protein
MIEGGSGFVEEAGHCVRWRGSGFMKKPLIAKGAKKGGKEREEKLFHRGRGGRWRQPIRSGHRVIGEHELAIEPSCTSEQPS